MASGLAGVARCTVPMMTTNVYAAIVTAYCHCSDCCGPNAAGITASGRPPVARKTVAAPRSVLLGSTVIIEGRRYTAEDRTSIRHEGRFDIYFRTHKEAREFGIRKLTVTIITQ